MFLYLQRVLSYMLLAIIVWIFLLFKGHTFLIRHSAVWVYYLKVLLINTGLLLQRLSEILELFAETLSLIITYTISPDCWIVTRYRSVLCRRHNSLCFGWLAQIKAGARHFPSFVLCAFHYIGWFSSSFLAWHFKELMYFRIL